MKKILSTLVLLLVFGQGLWAASQTWESGNTICALSDGVFFVTAKEGTDGAMADYPYETPGWRNSLSTVSQVVVFEGVTVIGEYTLPNLPENVTISLPNTLKEIHTDAFRYGSMTSITIPKSVTHVAANAFYCCDNLADVYCYASPLSLTWGGSPWDFNHSSDGWSFQTKMHVKSTYLDEFKDKFSGSKQLNVTYVGDLEPAESWKYHSAESFSEINEKFHELNIHNEAELALFANNVNNGFDYSLYSIYLDADLDLSDYLWVPIGTEDHPFRAVQFDGKGHTIQGLFVNNPEGDNNGLFGYVKGTKIEGYFPDAYDDGEKITIMGIKLLNSIVNGRNYTGGVIGRLYGQSEVQNVYSEAQVSGADYVGGVIGAIESQISINNSAYYDYKPVVENNVYVGSSITATGEHHGAVFGGRIEYSTPQNNYYIDSAVSSVANNYDEQLYPIRIGDIPEGVTVSFTASKSIEWEGTRYIGSNGSGNSCDLTLTILGMYSIIISSVNLNDAVVATSGGTYTTQPVIGSASEYVITVTATPSGIEGKGTEAEPYIIDTQSKWDTFANLVSTGHSTLGMHFRLDADLTITTMAGAPSPNGAFGLGNTNSFAGTFDGNNKTLTLDYHVSDEYAAPFRYIRGASNEIPVGATIKNLHVAGNITTSSKFAAGIVGLVSGVNCRIENCRSSVTINSSVDGDGSHGGLVGLVYSVSYSIHTSLNITGCSFDGKLLGSTTNHCGGLIGWVEPYNGHVDLNDCLFAPSEVTFGTDESATLFRANKYYDIVSVNNSFYTEPFGSIEKIPSSYALTTRPANFGTERATYNVSGITAHTGGIAWGDKYFVSNIGLYNDASNADLMSEVAANYGSQPVNVTLCDRTFYHDGSWNTLCLPFSLDENQTNKCFGDGKTLMELDTEGDYDGRVSGLVDNSTLYLNFKEASTIEAGKPYIIKWADGEDEANISFEGVTINNAAPTPVTSQNGKVLFTGIYNPYRTGGEDRTMLYLEADNKLYYPNADMTIGAFRAYFKLNDITIGDPSSEVRAFVLNFGDETTGVTAPLSIQNGEGTDAWYTLDGRRLSNKPTMKGIYLKGGKKIAIP